MPKCFADKRKFWIFLAVVAVSFLLRVIGFDWGGEGTTFHPDEGKVYKDAIIMARNSTLLSASSIYPAQVSQKILSVVYAIYFRLAQYKGVDYSEVICIYIARVLTAVFGTGTVAVAYFVGENFKRSSGLICSLLVGFCSPLVQQSHCSVMDTEVGFCFTVAILLSQLYFISLSKKEYLVLLGMSFSCGIATMEKWYGASITLVIICCVILKKILTQREFLAGLRQLVFSVLAYIGGLFLIAPNLFIFFRNTINGVNHVINDYESSASALESLYEMGSWIFSYMGIISLIFLVSGVIFFLKTKKIEAVALSVGLVETIYMTVSGQGAHLRWMQPLFIVYSIVVAIGMVYIYEESIVKGLAIERICIVLAIVVTLNIVVNGFLGFSLYGVNSADTSNISEKYLSEHSIKPEKCIYDRYTCLRPAGYSLYYDSVDVEDSFDYRDSEQYVIKLGRDYALSKDYDISGEEIRPIQSFKSDYYVNKMTNTKYDSISWKWVDLYSIPEALYYSMGFATGKLTNGFNYNLSDISQIKGLQYISYEDMKVKEKVGSIKLSSINKGKYIFERDDENVGFDITMISSTGEEIVATCLNVNNFEFEILDDYENVNLLVSGDDLEQFSGCIIEQ